MKKNRLLVTGAKIVRNKRKSEFSNKDYSMYISCKMIMDDDDVVGGREQIKCIFPDNSNHRAIFNAVNTAMKAQFGDKAEEKWKVLDNEAGRKADCIPLDKPIAITGYMVKFRLPEGWKMLKTIGTGDNKRKVDAFFLDLLCIGESAVRDSNGNMTEAWGEVPESIYYDLKERKVIEVIAYDTTVSIDPNDFESLKDDKKDEL